MDDHLTQEPYQTTDPLKCQTKSYISLFCFKHIYNNTYTICLSGAICIVLNHWEAMLYILQGIVNQCLLYFKRCFVRDFHRLRGSLSYYSTCASLTHVTINQSQNDSVPYAHKVPHTVLT